jgi:hypothetical protein
MTLSVNAKSPIEAQVEPLFKISIYIRSLWRNLEGAVAGARGEKELNREQTENMRKENTEKRRD